VPVFSRLIFQAVHWAARAGLRDECDDSRSDETSEAPKDPATESPELSKLRARRTGIRGETYGYWYLQRHGCVFVARNYMPRGAKGEIDLVGYDGDTLAFVEVRTRTVRDDALPALPELSVTTDKQRVVVRTAWRFLSERHVGDLSLPRRCAGDRQSAWDAAGSALAQGRVQPADVELQLI